MRSSSEIPQEISSFCEYCSQVLSTLTKAEARIEFVRRELPSLLRNKRIFARILYDVIQGGTYPNLRAATMFDNELVLHTDRSHLFSLRLFLWDPGEYTPVHDHGSWGVIGPVSGEFEVINYKREDDGSKEGYAHLVETARLKLLPGETAFTLPLDEGIHRVGNPTKETILSLSLYGKPLPRGYINGFEITNDRVYRIVRPIIRKKIRAIQALPSLDVETGKGVLDCAREHPLEVIRTACTAGQNHLSDLDGVDT